MGMEHEMEWLNAAGFLFSALAGTWLGWTLGSRSILARSPDGGRASADLMFKQWADKYVAECAATREFSAGIVSRLLDSNDKLADKCMAVTDGALERMRVESPAPAEAGGHHAGVGDFQYRDAAPEMVIPDRGSDPMG